MLFIHGASVLFRAFWYYQVFLQNDATFVMLTCDLSVNFVFQFGRDDQLCMGNFSFLICNY